MQKLVIAFATLGLMAASAVAQVGVTSGASPLTTELQCYAPLDSRYEAVASGWRLNATLSCGPSGKLEKDRRFIGCTSPEVRTVSTEKLPVLLECWEFADKYNTAETTLDCPGRTFGYLNCNIRPSSDEVAALATSHDSDGGWFLFLAAAGAVAVGWHAHTKGKSRWWGVVGLFWLFALTWFGYWGYRAYRARQGPAHSGAGPEPDYSAWRATADTQEPPRGPAPESRAPSQDDTHADAAPEASAEPSDEAPREKEVDEEPDSKAYRGRGDLRKGRVPKASSMPPWLRDMREDEHPLFDDAARLWNWQADLRRRTRDFEAAVKADLADLAEREARLKAWHEELASREAAIKEPEERKSRGVEYATDYHIVLAVSKDATAEEIQKAHRLAVVKYHPDRHPEWLREDYTRIFRAIQQAYEQLLPAEVTA